MTSTGAHSSVRSAARVMDADVLEVEADERGRASGDAISAGLAALDDRDRDRVAAIVATAGTTNLGVVDDLAGIGALARRAGDLVPRRRRVRRGRDVGAPRPAAVRRDRAVPTASSSTRTSGCSRRSTARPSCTGSRPWPGPTHTQHAEYLDVVTETPNWNPSDYAYHLSRRARGLPFWFSLATHGTAAYAAAVETGLRLAEESAELIRGAGHVELVVEPGLSIVVFRRLGWSRDDYYAWSDRALDDGLALVVPTSWRRRDGAALLLRQPPDHDGRRAGDPRVDGLSAARLTSARWARSWW